MKKIELACFTIESVVIAQKTGINRVELCQDASVGGISPSIVWMRQARQIFSNDLYVMIRPRGGNFVYSMQEIMQMQRTILEAKKIGINGLVFGVLTPNNKIDIAVNKALVALAHPLPCTFHRAFDSVENYDIALEEVIACGFSSILTSGGPFTAIQGKNQLQQLVKLANHRIEIMPGGGLRSANIKEVNQFVNANWYHTAAITDLGTIANLEEVLAFQKNLNIENQ